MISKLNQKQFSSIHGNSSGTGYIRYRLIVAMSNMVLAKKMTHYNISKESELQPSVDLHRDQHANSSIEVSVYKVYSPVKLIYIFIFTSPDLRLKT